VSKPSLLVLSRKKLPPANLASVSCPFSLYCRCISCVSQFLCHPSSIHARTVNHHRHGRVLVSPRLAGNVRNTLHRASYWQISGRIITDSRHLPAWSNVSRHVMNARLTLFEILFTQSVPGPLAHLIPRVLILICYLGVTYIMRATQGIYSAFFPVLQR
jgi:hypothetical protein